MYPPVLVQEPGEQARLAKEGFGLQVVIVESRIVGISLTTGERRRRGQDSRPFDFDVAITESAWAGNSLGVRYSYTFGRLSSGQVCKVSGTATVRFSRVDPSKDFHTLGDDITNEMAVEIFRRNYESVYLLHEALGLEAPSPWITQEVSLSSRNGVSRA